MEWILPGTVLPARREEAGLVETSMEAMFLGGGIVLSQVVSITGLEPHTVQNWVKRGFLSPPVNKKYTQRQLCRIININILRGNLSIDQSIRLMTYLNGDLTDERDDLVDDTMLFFLFVRLAARARYIGGTQTWDEALLQVTESYREPVPGAREKLMKVLKVMLTVWMANLMRQAAEAMIAEL